MHANKWVLDTGATDRMICDLSSFTTPPRRVHVQIQLPTGDVILATQCGDVYITEKLALHNALYVPRFVLILFM